MSKRKQFKPRKKVIPTDLRKGFKFDPKKNDSYRLQLGIWMTRFEPNPELVSKEPDGIGGFFYYYAEDIPKIHRMACDQPIEDQGRYVQAYMDKVMNLPIISSLVMAAE